MILVFVGCESFFLMHEPAGVGKQWLKQYISFFAIEESVAQ